MSSSRSDSIPPDDPFVGTIIDDRYRVLRRLGAGGMGAVYVAEHLLTERLLAIKTLLSDYAQDSEAVLRFQREARAAARVGNEHIVDVTDMGVLRGNVPYMVLELLDGCTVREALAPGPMPVARTIHIALQCCSAFAAAHAKGIVHRDIKPDNVFLVRGRREPDFVKVLDFGISKIRHGDSSVESFATSTGIIMGTLHYMSPEQIEGSAAIDHRTDIYAMGAVLYEMLCGHPPFQASSIPAFAVQITMAPVPPLELERPTVPVALARVVERALAKKPADRFPTMEVLAEALTPFRAYEEPEGSIVPTGPMERRDSPAGSPEPALESRQTVSLPAEGEASDVGVRASSASGGFDSGIVPMSSTIRRERSDRRLGRWLGVIGGLVLVAATMFVAARWLGADDATPPTPTSSGAEIASSAARPAPPSAVPDGPSSGAAESPATPPPSPTLGSAVEADSRAAESPATSLLGQGARGEGRGHGRGGVGPNTPPEQARGTTRRVLVRNERRAESIVAITCSSRSTRAIVPAFESRTLRVPQGDCTVRCSSSLGLARCPLALPASRSIVEVR